MTQQLIHSGKIEDQLVGIILGLKTEDWQRFAGKTVVISGACGFLGSWFVATFQQLNKVLLKDNPVQVIAIDSFIATDSQNALNDIDDPSIHFIRADITTWHWLGIKVDFIIHAAGIASPIYYRKYPIETIDGMVLGLKNLLECAKDQGKSFEEMLVFSSSEMYGNPTPDMVPTPETYNGNVATMGPRSCYDESKRMEEAYSAAYQRIHNIPVKVVRPFNVYGPGMRLADDRVAPKFILAALRHEPITVHFPGIQTRTMCYITDAMTGFFKVLLNGKDGEVYNIGNAEPEISMVDLAERIKHLITTNRAIRFMESSKSTPPGEWPEVVINKIPMPPEYPTDQAQRRCPDLTKASQELGYMPKVSLDLGLNLTIEWCQELIRSK